MSKSLTIKVERQDIEGGLPDECNACPIALAAVRACPWDGVDPHVARDFMAWNDVDGKRHYADLPIEAQEFILRFDDEFGEFGERNVERVNPLTFTIKARDIPGAKEAGL